jgi:hypothetical protein
MQAPGHELKIVAGKSYRKGWQNTVDLLIKLACTVKRKILFLALKAADLTSWYKEVNCTDPSPSVRIP